MERRGESNERDRGPGVCRVSGGTCDPAAGDPAGTDGADHRRCGRRAGHHDRLHRAEQPGPRAALLGGRDPVGQHRLPARPRRGDPGGRLGPDPIRRQAALDGRPDPVRRWLGPVRHGLERGEPDRLPGAPGRGRRHDLPAHADPGHADRSCGPGGWQFFLRPGGGHGQPAHRGRPDPRPGAGRGDLELARLALAVPDQRAGLRGRPLPGLAVPPGRRSRLAQHPLPAGPARPAADRARPGRDPVRPVERGQERRSRPRRRAGPADRRAGAAGRLRGLDFAPGPARP